MQLNDWSEKESNRTNNQILKWMAWLVLQLKEIYLSVPLFVLIIICVENYILNCPFKIFKLNYEKQTWIRSTSPKRKIIFIIFGLSGTVGFLCRSVFNPALLHIIYSSQNGNRCDDRGDAFSNRWWKKCYN